MTRYVFKKKQGLVIGSGNVFFWFGSHPCIETYRAIVWAQPYQFNEDGDDHGWLTHGIETPAFQMMWEVTEGIIDITRHGHTLPHSYRHHKPKYLIKKWLDENAPGYGLRPLDEVQDPRPAVFFTNRKHAVAFVRFIEQALEGMIFDPF